MLNYFLVFDNNPQKLNHSYVFNIFELPPCGQAPMCVFASLFQRKSQTTRSIKQAHVCSTHHKCPNILSYVVRHTKPKGDILYKPRSRMISFFIYNFYIDRSVSIRVLIQEYKAAEDCNSMNIFTH